MSEARSGLTMIEIAERNGYPPTAKEVLALAAEVERLKRALGDIGALGDRCEDCDPHDAPFATHVTANPLTGTPVFLCAECAESTRAAFRKAESKGCGRQPVVEEHEQDEAVLIALAALRHGEDQKQ